MYYFVAVQFGSDHLDRCLAMLSGNDLSRLVKVDYKPDRKIRADVVTHSVLRATDVPSTATGYPCRLFIIVPRESADVEFPCSGYGWAQAQSVEDFDSLLTRLAETHDWAVIPWGGFMTFDSFAFVTRSRLIYARVLEEMNRSGTVKVSYTNCQQQAFLAGHFACESSLADCARHAVIEATKKRDLDWLWEHAVGAGGWVYMNGRSAEAYLDERDELVLPGGVLYLGVLNDGDAYMSDRSGFYRAETLAGLKLFASNSFSHINGPCGLMLPGELDERLARELLQEWFLAEPAFLLQKSQRLLTRTPWMFTMADCHGDVDYNQFSTSNHDLMRRFLIASGKSVVSLA